MKTTTLYFDLLDSKNNRIDSIEVEDVVIPRAKDLQKEIRGYAMVFVNTSTRNIKEITKLEYKQNQDKYEKRENIY